MVMMVVDNSDNSVDGIYNSDSGAVLAAATMATTVVKCRKWH